MPEALRVWAPATSANLGPGFDALALALDLSNEVEIVRRPGPLAVSVEGEGAGELPSGPDNLVCRALAALLSSLDDLEVRCRNRIPLGRGLGSSAAAVCAGLAAGNALADRRLPPDELVRLAAGIEGHADNAAACLWGGIVAVGPGLSVVPLAVPPGLAFVTVVPLGRVSTDDARRALPAQVPFPDAADTLARAVGLALALRDGRIDDLPPLLVDRLHEPYRAALVPGLEALRDLCGSDGCLGVTISGSGPSVLVWCREASASEVADRVRRVVQAAGMRADVRMARSAPGGVRARWVDGGGATARLAGAIG